MNKFKQNCIILGLLLIGGGTVGASGGIQIQTTTPHTDTENTASSHVGGAEDTFSVFSTGFVVTEAIQGTSDYTNGLRFTLSGDAVFLHSTQYGDFNFSGSMQFNRSPSVHAQCSGESVSYFINSSPILTSSAWGNLTIQGSGSYYCPASGKFGFTAIGESLGTIGVAGQSGGESFVFGNAKVQIAGSTNTTQTQATQSEYTSLSGAVQQQSNFVQVDAKLEGGLLSLTTSLNRNIVNITKGVTPISNTTSLNTFAGGLKYYDYRKTQAPSPSHQQNSGQILPIGTFSGGAIGVTGENTLIVLGGNVYIRNDIYNTNPNSVLTIVVKRDENNRKNGGNIYIHPSVTNIDAVLVAEGSLLSYNAGVITATLDPDDLRKQLLIYGAVNTRNTLNDSDIPLFGTDHAEGGLTTGGNTYNLGNLRSFQPIWNSSVSSVHTCGTPQEKITAYGASHSSPEQYAFAGKKQCFLDQGGQANLRTTQKLASVVIEYNPLLQTKPPRILQN